MTNANVDNDSVNLFVSVKLIVIRFMMVTSWCLEWWLVVTKKKRRILEDLILLALLSDQRRCFFERKIHES